MSDIFLSYAREDIETAKRLAGRLDDEGMSVFWDRDIHAGKNFRSVIKEQLKSASCVVVLWSVASVESDWVLDEAEEGKSEGILVPATIGSVRPPIGFRQIQTAEMSAWKGETSNADFDRLLEAIRAVRGSTAALSGRREPDFHAEKPGRAVDPVVLQFSETLGKFYDQPLNVRQEAARDVKKLAPRMSLDTLVAIGNSNSPENRVAVAIGLRAWFKAHGGKSLSINVMSLLEAGLQDRHSRVRYRYAQLAGDYPALVDRFHEVLSSLAENDSNASVRDAAIEALKKAG